MSRSIYFPGLNGLRAIAAISVVIDHITIALKEFNLNPFIGGSFDGGTPKGFILGGYGVTIFFVLSGFLITYLLQAERDTGSINVKKFYIRRILRIWPMYYLYLIICLIVIIKYTLPLNNTSLLFYIFYSANIPFILSRNLLLLTHYWSLGVEEQFYLFWPWVNKKISNFFVPILIVIFTLISLKVFFHFFYPGSIIEMIITVTRFHCMMIGGLGAILYKQHNKLFNKIVDNKIIQFICWVIILLIAINKFHIASVIDNEIVAVVALFLIIGQINIKNRIINLENSFLNFLGKISYGIYVIQPLIIFFLSKFLGSLSMPLLLNYFLVYFGILGITIAVAYVSYTFFEMRFLDLKKKFAVVHSSYMPDNNA